MLFPASASLLANIPSPHFDQSYCDQNGIDGRCHPSGSITLRPGCPHLTIAHEIAHWLIHRLMERELTSLNIKPIPEKVDRFTLEKYSNSSTTLRMLRDVYEKALQTPEIIAAHGRDSGSWEDTVSVSAVTRSDEVLANAFAQYVVEEIMPDDLSHLTDCQTDALATEGYWHRTSFELLRALVRRAA